ncbi:T9SS type A sorting domain-containing protein [Kordia jejudonensis]|uniref:T9SS type A sorting domain-containing protein n=1 Tax=Kordia jejudonensis TaxID=1348245 RepID=UPI0006296A5C|nr:T9SS type A sorting domain-containing protein [Kordia jejudonensis]
MKTTKYLTYVFLLWICFIFTTHAQYSPTINISQEASGLVAYDINNAGDNTFVFTLFGDGTFSSQSMPTHIFPPNQSGYISESYFVRAYDPNLPPKKVANISPVGTNTGTLTNPTISMTGEVDLMTSWATAQHYENFYIIAFRNTSAATYPGGCLEFHYNNNEISVNQSNTKIYNNWVSNQSIPLPSSTHTHKITWNFFNLLPNEVRYVYVPAETLVPVGQTIHLDVQLKTDCASRGINSPHSFLSRKYPHDPNFKIANKQCVKSSLSDHQELIYTIGFFNDGEYFAKDVFVKDHLPSDLDPNKISLVDYEVQPSWFEEDDVLDFEFLNINLPGTNQTSPKVYSYDEAFTYFSFKICTKENLKGCISNEASIIFDTQPEFITDISEVCAYEDCTDYDLCNADANKSNMEIPVNNIKPLEFSVFPNPVKNQLNIKVNFNTQKTTELSISLLDFSGKVIKSYTIPTQNSLIFTKIIDLKDVSSGLYFITLKNNEGQYTRKVIKN